MFDRLQNPLALLGRILLSLLFITSGFAKITGFDGAVGYIASAGLPVPALVAVLTIAVELGGGLLVLFGFHARLAGLVLAVFTLLAALIFHAYWAVPPEQLMSMKINFWKNFSIAGGFLMLAAFGPGSISVDGRRPVDLRVSSPAPAARR